MATFFQTLRDIQNRERNSGTLTEVDESFYDDASKYLQELLEVVNENPLSLEAYQLRDAQTITTEICERREFKIITSAISNVQKTHNIVKGYTDESTLFDEIPYNTTPEEEKLYKTIISSIMEYRNDLMKDVQANSNTEIESDNKDSDETEQWEEVSHEDEEIEDIPPEFDEPPKPKPKNEPQIMQMEDIEALFGQVPDDTLFDENNQPVQVKQGKHDIQTPFNPSEAPKEDTIQLQNKEKKEESLKDDVGVDEVKQTMDSTDKEETKLKDTPTTKHDDNHEEEIQEQTSESQNSVSIDSIEFNEEELVYFKQKVTTDFLDEDEKTYGPFNVNDMAVLPGAIVKILLSRNIISILE